MRTVIYMLLALVLLGCEEAVDPVIQTEFPFSMYGYLDPGESRQAVRVFTIDGRLERITRSAIDARFSSRPATGGQEQVWADTLVEYDSGSIGHVFQAAFQPDFDTDYRIRAERSDGRAATAVVRTPRKAAVEVLPGTGVRSNIVVPVVVQNAERILRATVTYHVSSSVFPGEWSVPIDYSGRLQDRGNSADFLVDLSLDLGDIFTVTRLRPGIDPIYLDGIDLTLFITTAEWSPPGGRFDPELLVQPGTFSNVENGFGFIGGGYTEFRSFLPSEEIADLAGFDPKPLP